MARSFANMPWRSICQEAFEKVALGVKFLCFLHVTNNYLCGAVMVYGPSMLPTFNLMGDIVLVERLSTRFEKIKSGDIILVCSPEDPRKIVTKRVTGMEGDRVAFVGTKQGGDWSQSIIVPKGHVWVQGDNVHDSRDSRHFGPVPYGLVRGKAFWRIWPPEGFGSPGGWE